MIAQRPSPPHHRTIFAVDIEGSTTRNNTAKFRLRAAMYDMVERSLLANGITEQHCDPLVDRGDGILALVHPVDEIPKTLLLSHVVPSLSELLAEHEDQFGRHLRLRAVLHAGEVHNDGRGNYGEALDIAFRLLDAPEVKRTFRTSTAPLLLVVSDLIFNTIVRQGYEGIDERAFSPATDVLVGGTHYEGWVALPDTRSSLAGGGLARPTPGARILRAARRFDERKHVV